MTLVNTLLNKYEDIEGKIVDKYSWHGKTKKQIKWYFQTKKDQQLKKNTGCGSVNVDSYTPAPCTPR